MAGSTVRLRALRVKIGDEIVWERYNKACDVNVHTYANVRVCSHTYTYTHTHTHTHTHTIVVAFLVALNQNKQLLGQNGLLPVPLYLSRLRQHFGLTLNSTDTPSLAAFNAAPTLLWWVPEESTDIALDAIALVGLGLSCLLVLLGSGNAVVFAALWALYHSLVNVGQRWWVDVLFPKQCIRNPIFNNR